MTAATLRLAVEVHDELLKLVAPATPGSIRASSLAYGRNGALFSICVAAIISFFIFILPIVGKAAGWGFESPDFAELCQVIGGAGMGSSFYSLWSASEYIKNSTFNPKYNNTYLIRMALGVLAGLILAYFFKDLLGMGKATTDTSQIDKIKVATLALVGGYGAEVVVRILERVKDTLIALVSGSDKEKLDATRQKAEADADRKASQAIAEVVRKLQDVSTAQDKDAAVKKVMADLLSRK